MPYQQLEELTSRRHEKVALFLTAENVGGLFVLGLPAYIATLHTPLVLRFGILIAAAVLGVMLTSDVHGMALYERVLWWCRGRVRKLLGRTTVTVAEMAAKAFTESGDRALPVGGEVRRARPLPAAPVSVRPVVSNPVAPARPRTPPDEQREMSDFVTNEAVSRPRTVTKRRRRPPLRRSRASQNGTMA